MARSDIFPRLGERTTVLLVNFSIFYFAFVATSDLWLPTGGLESVWLLCAAALWLLNLLSAPWFMPPRDALANAITAGAILITMEIAATLQFSRELETLRWIAVFYCCSIVILSISTLLLNEKDMRSAEARFAFRLTAIFGKGEILYTVPASIGVLGAYQQSYSSIASLLLLWVIFVVARPVEACAAAIRSWRAEMEAEIATNSIGTIDRIDHPNIIRVRLGSGGNWQPGKLHIAAMPNGDQHYVFSLFSQVQGADVIGTGLSIAPAQEKWKLAPGQVCVSHDEEKAVEFIEN